MEDETIVDWSAVKGAAIVRGSAHSNPKPLDKDALHETIVKLFRGYAAAIGAGLAKPDANKPLMQAATAQFDGDIPSELDVDAQAAALNLVGLPVQWNDDGREDTFVRYWAAASGCDFALRALARSYELRPRLEGGPSALWVIDARRGGKLDTAMLNAQPEPWFYKRQGAWRGLRHVLALADDKAFSEARATAAKLRETEIDALKYTVDAGFADAAWCKADAAEILSRQQLAGVAEIVASLPTAVDATELVTKLIVAGSQWHIAQSMASVRYDIVAKYGGGAASVLLAFLDKAVGASDQVRDVANALAVLGRADVAEYFVARLGTKELRATAAEFLGKHPTLALAPLTASAVGKSGEASRAVLRTVIAALGDETDARIAELPEASQVIANEIAARTRIKEEAPASELPRVLAEPPWKNKKAKKKLDVVAVEMIVKDERILPNKEREALANRYIPDPAKEAENLARIKEAHDKPIPGYSWNRLAGTVLAKLSKPKLLEQLATCNFATMNFSSYENVMTILLAREGLDVLPGILRFAEYDGLAAVETLVVVDSPRVAPVMADAMARLKKARAMAQKWLLDFPGAAATGLIPDAIGKASKTREIAENTLRMLATRGHRDRILEAGKAYGDEAATAVKQVLDFDPLLRFPAKLPKMPAFWQPASFSRPFLRSDKGASAEGARGTACPPHLAVPVSAVDAIGTMLAFPVGDSPYIGLEQTIAACDRASLADFSWDLFQAWLVAGAPSKEGWAFQQLGLLGNDDIARRLTPLIRAWPGEGGHARAVSGLDVLARIGTDVALMHLHGVAQKVKFKGLQEKARGKIDQIAEARGLTAEELADRLVPDLGLEDDGSMVLDFGPRSFKVTFDESLKPFVIDEKGKRLPDVPKPGKNDDAEKAKEAVATWKALKKDAKTIASGQLLRLELAMCARRRWEPETFEQFLVQHPLMIHIVRRLVWGVYENGKLTGTFRVAEDRSFADASDAALTIKEGAEIGVLHRLETSDEIAKKWSDVLGDYEIIQPFSQLGRETFAPTSEEKAAKALTRVVGLVAPVGKVLGLDNRGWRRGPPQDAGVVCWYEKDLRDGFMIQLDLDPGIYTGIISESPEQKLGNVIVQKSGTWGNEGQRTFGDLSPVIFSELVRDLESLRPA